MTFVFATSHCQYRGSREFHFQFIDRNIVQATRSLRWEVVSALPAGDNTFMDHETAAPHTSGRLFNSGQAENSILKRKLALHCLTDNKGIPEKCITIQITSISTRLWKINIPLYSLLAEGQVSLLRLLPSRWEAPICGELFTVQLPGKAVCFHEVPAYTALSYALACRTFLARLSSMIPASKSPRILSLHRRLSL